METSPVQAEPGLLARMLDWLRSYAARQEELGRLTRGDIALMASDLGLTEAELREVMPRAADNRVLMEGMLQARGLDPAAVRRGFAALMRELELTCTRCPHTARCRRELGAGTAALHCHEYCVNADTIDELLAAQTPH
jgi:hypothetical protein